MGLVKDTLAPFQWVSVTKRYSLKNKIPKLKDLDGNRDNEAYLES